VARLEHPAKNHARLIGAFNRFKAATGSPWRLALAGGDWHGAEAIHGLARASPFASDIHILGFVPAADLPDWYRAADVFVFPSLYEGFGMPPVEAMACGCPVLSSRAGALRETVGEAADCLEPLDIGQIQSQLTRAAIDGAWRARLRAAGFARAREFDWASTAEATLGVYSRAAGRRAPAMQGRPHPGRPAWGDRMPARAMTQAAAAAPVPLEARLPIPSRHVSTR
jgi:glycosyltransferase involved in cell wall biosynthesis